MSGMSQERLASCSQVSLYLKGGGVGWGGGGGGGGARALGAPPLDLPLLVDARDHQAVCEGLAQGGKDPTDADLCLRVRLTQR